MRATAASKSGCLVGGRSLPRSVLYSIYRIDCCRRAKCWLAPPLNLSRRLYPSHQVTLHPRALNGSRKETSRLSSDPTQRKENTKKLRRHTGSRLIVFFTIARYIQDGELELLEASICAYWNRQQYFREALSRLSRGLTTLSKDIQKSYVMFLEIDRGEL